MGLDTNLVGAAQPKFEFAYSWRQCVLYALGVGAKVETELPFLLESRGPKVLPTFAVVPAFTALKHIVANLGVNPLTVLHGEQSIEFAAPIPQEDTLTTIATVSAIYDKGKDAVIFVESQTHGKDSALLFKNNFTLFAKGAGGFGGDRGPSTSSTAPTTIPESPPDWTATDYTLPEQAALYRLSGDENPLHLAPEVANFLGFDQPILHGLCTLGFAGRQILHNACKGDPLKISQLGARFSGVVYPGDTLVTKGWQTDPRTLLFETRTQDDRLVLKNGTATIAL